MQCAGEEVKKANQSDFSEAKHFAHIFKSVAVPLCFFHYIPVSLLPLRYALPLGNSPAGRRAAVDGLLRKPPGQQPAAFAFRLLGLNPPPLGGRREPGPLPAARTAGPQRHRLGGDAPGAAAAPAALPGPPLASHPTPPHPPRAKRAFASLFSTPHLCFWGGLALCEAGGCRGCAPPLGAGARCGMGGSGRAPASRQHRLHCPAENAQVW